MTFRVLVAFFLGIVAVITTVLIPVADFGDKNEPWSVNPSWLASRITARR